MDRSRGAAHLVVRAIFSGIHELLARGVVSGAFYQLNGVGSLIRDERGPICKEAHQFIDVFNFVEDKHLASCDVKSHHGACRSATRSITVRCKSSRETNSPNFLQIL